MINLTKSNAATRIARAITRAAMTPVQTILVTDEQAAELAALGQSMRVGDVVITTDPTVEPPAPAPKPTPPAPTLDQVKASRKAAIQMEAEMAVAERFPGQNDLLMLLSDSLAFVKLSLQGVDLSSQAATIAALEETTSWVDGIRSTVDESLDAIDALATIEEVDAHAFTLPPPPAVIVKPRNTRAALKASSNKP